MTAQNRDIGGVTDGVVGIQAQQAGSLDVDGSSIDLQSYDMPQSGKVVCSLNSQNSSDDIDFKVQESSTGSGSWSDTGDEVTGLDDTKAEGVIDLRNLQDGEQYLRVVATGNLASTNVELAACAVFGGKKTE